VPLRNSAHRLRTAAALTGPDGRRRNLPGRRPIPATGMAAIRQPTFVSVLAQHRQAVGTAKKVLQLGCLRVVEHGVGGCREIVRQFLDSQTAFADLLTDLRIRFRPSQEPRPCWPIVPGEDGLQRGEAARQHCDGVQAAAVLPQDVGKLDGTAWCVVGQRDATPAGEERQPRRGRRVGNPGRSSASRAAPDHSPSCVRPQERQVSA
jgi:hypothetical protein